MNTNVMQGLVLITTVSNDQIPDTVGGRIAWVRGQRKMRQAEVAKLAKVSQGTIGNLESNIRKSPRSLLAICRALRANPNFIETGTGPWEATGVQENPLFVMTDEEQELLHNLRHLLDDDREAFAREIAAKAEKQRAYLAKHAPQVVGGRPVAHANALAADAIAKASVPVTPSLKQRSLFDPPA